MIIRIPVGRIVRWAGDMKHGYSPLEEGDDHAFLNHAGLTKEEAKKSGGSNGDPWCRFCGRNYRKHPNIPYPVFVPPPEWEKIPEVDVPVGHTLSTGQLVEWPYEVVSDRGLKFHVHATNEEEAFRRAGELKFKHVNPVFVRLNLPVPEVPGVCSNCGKDTLVTTAPPMDMGEFLANLHNQAYEDALNAPSGLCGRCTVASYVERRYGEPYLDPVSASPEPETQPASRPSGEYKICPDCAEEVRAAARKCRFCGYFFEEPAAPLSS